VGRTARAGKSGRACTIAAEPDRKVVKAAVKSARGQGAKIVSRTLELNEVDDMDAKLLNMEDDVAEVLREEQEEKQLAQADMQLTRGENLVKHEKEIMARPKRTWFESEKEKRVSKKAGRAELNGPESVLGKKQKQKLSGKDKKRLDDRRERTEGKMWKKGKESEAVAKAERRESKARKGSKGIPPTKRPKSRRPQKR
jgi:ATP-dependent RNA helicase DDX27